MSISLLDLKKVEEGSKALLEVLKNDRVTTAKKLLDVPAPIFLQIDFVKIPKVKRRVIRIPLKNSVLTEQSDVCLIVADIIRGRNVNHEVTLNHYKKLFEKKGIEDAQKLHIMSSRQIRVDYSTFEAKRKLCKMFDFFLIDNKISSYLRPKLGKEFPKARKWPIPVRIKRKDLKEEISSKLKKTSLVLDGSGTTKTAQVGHINMTPREISENIIRVGDYIAERFPGGWDNIRSLHVKGLRSVALPIYLSLISKNEVPLPTIDMKRQKRKLATQEASIVGKKVVVYRSGRVKVLHNNADTILSKPEVENPKIESSMEKTAQNKNNDKDGKQVAEIPIDKQEVKKQKRKCGMGKTFQNEEDDKDSKSKFAVIPIQRLEAKKRKMKHRVEKTAHMKNDDEDGGWKIVGIPIQISEVEKQETQGDVKKTTLNKTDKFYEKKVAEIPEQKNGRKRGKKKRF